MLVFGILSAALYGLIEPQQNREWTPAHARLPYIEFMGKKHNPAIIIRNLRDFNWYSETPKRYDDVLFKLENIVELKAAVSHFSAASDIAHVFMTFVLDNGREIGVSIEARREHDEAFSLIKGLFAGFEMIYVVATPKDLYSIRKINKEAVHVYPLKETKQKARELFLLIANEINALHEKPSLYHLFFKNCTNQLVKHVSILTKKKYPWYFQTLAPGLTGRTLYELDLIDLPDTMSFKEIQAKTLLKNDN